MKAKKKYMMRPRRRLVFHEFNLRDRRVSDRLLVTEKNSIRNSGEKRVLSVRDYLNGKKSPRHPQKVFSSSPLEDNESISFPNDVSAIKAPNPLDKNMAGRKKVSFDYIPGLDAPVRNPFHEAGEDSPASSPVHRSTRKAKRSSSSSEQKPSEDPETITVSDDSGDEGKAKRSKGGQEDKSYQGIQYKSECVTLYDYFSLEEGEYLNDAIINFHLAYLAQEKLSEDNKKDVHIFSTHFYTKLSNVPKKKKGESTNKSRGERAYERVQSWTKKIDLFSKKLVIVPICEDNHWYVLLICNPGCVDSPPDERLVRGDPYFIVMDSLGGYHTTALSAMRSYLRYEYLARKGRPLSLTKEKMGEVEAPVPEQDNDCDCGVYLLHYIELIFRDPGKFYWSRKLPTFKKWFTTSDIKNKREDIANVIKEVAARSPKTAHMDFPEIRFSRRSKRHVKTEPPIDVDKVAEKEAACGEDKEEEENDGDKDQDDGDKDDNNLEEGELREAEAEVQKSKAEFEEVVREEKRAKERQEQKKKKKEQEKKKKEEEKKKQRLEDMMISSEDSASPMKLPKVQLERLPKMPAPPPPLEEVLGNNTQDQQQPGKNQNQSKEAEPAKVTVEDESLGKEDEPAKDCDEEASPGDDATVAKEESVTDDSGGDAEDVKERGRKRAKRSKSKKRKKKKKRRKSDDRDDSSEHEEDVEEGEVKEEEDEEKEVLHSDSDSSPRPFNKKGKKKRSRGRSRSDSKSGKRRRKRSRSVETVSEKSKRKRDSAERDEDSGEPASPEWSESSDSSPRPSRKKGKKRSKERSDSGGGRRRKRSEDKKGKKKESRSLDPSDLRNSLSSSSAFVKRTLASALRDSPSRKKRSTRSVEISYREEEENEDSSSFFHVRGKRKVERVVELDSPESFDRTNPFSNARDWRERRKGSGGKFGGGSARKFRR